MFSELRATLACATFVKKTIRGSGCISEPNLTVRG